MSGIVGLFRVDGGPVDLHDLERVADAARHRSRDGRELWIGASIGLGYRHFSFPSGISVALDGRLDDVPDRDLHSAAAFVAAAYDRFGDSFASHLNGDFAVALFDAGRRRLALARDRMGARTLYYGALPRLLLFGSEIKSILVHPDVDLRVDEDGLADLVLNGHCDGRTTCFKNIFSVPPGHVVWASNDDVVVRQHWDFDPSHEVRYRSLGDYADHFRSLFEQAVRRRLNSPHPIAIAVSGGVDSSSILCQAAALARRGTPGAKLHGFTLSTPDDPALDETAFVAEVEKRAGVPITAVAKAGAGPQLDADSMWYSEIPQLTWNSQAALLAHAREAGCASVLSGYFGDQMLFEPAYLVDLARRGQWLKIRRDLRQFDRWMSDVPPVWFRQQFAKEMMRALPPRWLFRTVRNVTGRRRWQRRWPRWYTSAFVDRAIARARSRAGVERRCRSHHAEQYYQRVTSGFYSAEILQETAAGLMHGVEVHYPFRDRDLVAFLMAIPGDVVHKDGVPKGILREALRETLPDTIRDRRWKADGTAAVNGAFRVAFPRIRQLLTSESWSVQTGLVDGGALTRELDTAEVRLPTETEATLLWQLEDLAALELWLRQFFGEAVA